MGVYVHPVAGPIAPNEEQIWTTLHRGVGVGAVIIVNEVGSDRILLVQKAPRPGYEFSNKWVLPGGMIRQEADAETFESSIQRTLRERFEAESGVPAKLLRRVRPTEESLTAVSSYVVHGHRRYTLVCAFRGDLTTPANPSPADRSISAAAFLRPWQMWNDIAPASRLIVARNCSPYTTGLDHRARQAIRAAWKSCSMWAADVGLPPPAYPEI